jgi:hypothetical protein
MTQIGRSRVRFPASLNLSIPNPSSCTMTLASTQPLTGISTRTLPCDKPRPAIIGSRFVAIYEAIVWKMWQPRRLIILWASTACGGDNLIFINTDQFWKIQKRTEQPHIALVQTHVFSIPWSCLINVLIWLRDVKDIFTSMIKRPQYCSGVFRLECNRFESCKMTEGI